MLIWTEKRPQQETAHKKLPFWYKEVHIPVTVIITVNALLILVSLILEVGPTARKLTGLILFLGIFFLLVVSYMRKYLSHLSKDNDAIMLMGILTSMSVLVIETVKSGRGLSPFFIPLAGIILLAAMLLGESAGIILSVAVSVVLGLMYGFNFEYFIYHFVAGLVAVWYSGRIKRRQDIMTNGVYVAVSNIIFIFIFTLLGRLRASDLQGNLLWAVANGFSGAILVLALLSPFETFFSRITHIKLIELSDFNQPVLKRLMLEAPGTFQHSLSVASIAEQAAEAIGADSLLVRVGSFYHDVGKLIKPEYFIENQIATENPHDFIQPSMSGLVVISHVREGASIARLQNLDRPIIDLIEQHHGTSLMYVFYQKALESMGETKEAVFRYPGPKPKTKESAILMLADSCEAATRAVESLSPGKIKDTVEKVINNKFTDGQFDEAPISLSDLHKLAESMITTLTGMHHARVEYEQQETKERGPDSQG